MEARQSAPLKIERQGEACLSCHAPVNQGIGGVVVNSVYPNREGTPLFLGVGTFAQTIDHRTPLEDRWGGWYVSGTHGPVRHMGNAVAPDPLHPGDLEEAGSQNLTSLATKFDSSNYLRPTSDLVALMTLEHQVTMMNFISRLAAYSNLSRGDYATNEKRFNALVEDMLAYMLFVDETRLKSPVKGVSGFSKNFEARGPKDGQGRSLRDFDLQKRMFKYPLTYMIYTEPFDKMPAKARDRVLKRLHEVLTGEDKSERFSKIAATDKKNVLEILRATKPNLPDYWR